MSEILTVFRESKTDIDPSDLRETDILWADYEKSLIEKAEKIEAKGKEKTDKKTDKKVQKKAKKKV